MLTITEMHEIHEKEPARALKAFGIFQLAVCFPKVYIEPGIGCQAFCAHAS